MNKEEFNEALKKSKDLKAVLHINEAVLPEKERILFDLLGMIEYLHKEIEGKNEQIERLENDLEAAENEDY